MKHVLTLLACLTVVAGCAPMKIPRDNSVKPLTPATLSLLNGTYSNKPDSGDYFLHQSLWNQLKLRGQWSSRVKDSQLTVVLKATGPNMIQATLMRDSIEIDKKLLKGKTKQDYFYLRYKCAYWGVVPVYWAIVGLKARLGTNGSGLLIADSEFSHGGGILIIMTGSTDNAKAYYNRK